MIPLVLDYRPPYLGNACSEASLLLLPMGRETVLDHALWSVGCHSVQQVVVLATFPTTPAYEERLHHASGRDVLVLEATAVSDWAATLESQEVVCVLDGLRQPLEMLDPVQLSQRQAHGCGATHFISVAHGWDAVSERVERDVAGRVRTVRRSYTLAAPPEVANTAVLASFVRAPALKDLTFSSAEQLRTELCRKGVLASDVAVGVEMADLSEESGLLRVNERVIERLQVQADRDRGRVASEALHDTTSFTHPSVRLIGPVVIHPGCTIEEQVTVVGPAIVGDGVRLAAGSTVVQSIIASSVVVPPGAGVFHRVIAHDWTAPTVNGTRTENGTPTIAAGPNRPRFVEHRSTSTPRSEGAHKKPVQAVVKRSLDITLAALGLVILLPLMLVVALLIILDSKGPVLFRHMREGAGGEEFSCLKFRTMVSDAHEKQRELYAKNEVDGPQFKLQFDPRITRLGRFLRSTNIDELPQLWSVLLGQMSLIGPRPSPFRENQICVSWRRARLSVRPGISGMWQICRDNREGGDFHQWIYYDVLYVRHWSLWLDIKILAATLLTLGGRWRVPLEWLISPAQLRSGYVSDAEYGWADDTRESPWPSITAA